MKTRVITAVILLPLLLLALLATPKIVTVLLFGVLSAIAAYELVTATGLLQNKRLTIYSMVMAFAISINSYFALPVEWARLVFFLFWVLLFAEMMLGGLKPLFEKTFVCFAAGVVIPYLLTALVRIFSHTFGRFYILIPFVLAFLSDTGAYFVGRAFGKHKLAPTISPKKTVEGVVGGVIGGIIGIAVYCFVLQQFFGFQVNYVFAVIYGAIGSIAAVFGDLCFSVIKRQTGIKDYGNLIPGHGGVLDRFDSMIVVAPLAEILLNFLPLAVKL